LSFIAITFHASRKFKLRFTTSSAKLWRCSAVAILELFGTKSCQYTQEMREWLEWKGTEFVEYDVEADLAARERMHSLANGQRTVPMLVDGDKVVQIGWQGRGCVVSVE
jgi:glutaredoxin 3